MDEPKGDEMPASSRIDLHTGHRVGHDDAVAEAEAHRIVRALRPYGVLHRDALARECAAHGWHEGSFDEALAAAVRSGAVTKLPLGFYRLER
jgi:hypothetical protein